MFTIRVVFAIYLILCRVVLFYQENVVFITILNQLPSYVLSINVIDQPFLHFLDNQNKIHQRF